jgi:Helix-turn-helix
MSNPKVNEPLFLVEPRGHATGAFVRLKAERLRSQSDIRTALDRCQREARYGHHAVWIAPSVAAIRLLLGTLPHRPLGDQRLLLLERTDGDRHGLLHVLFRFVVSVDEGVGLLPTDELGEVLNSANRADLFIGAALARADEAVVLYRGDLEPLIVSRTWFRAHPDGPRPDVSDVAVMDFGQTVRLGNYEAATDAILYEFDAEYRRRAKRRQLQTDRSIGGALRRLRLQRGLRQSDFPGLTAKEVARIERGEVKKPRQRTLAAIAKRIGVSAEEISTY